MYSNYDMILIYIAKKTTDAIPVEITTPSSSTTGSSTSSSNRSSTPAVIANELDNIINLSGSDQNGLHGHVRTPSSVGSETPTSTTTSEKSVPARKKGNDKVMPEVAIIGTLLHKHEYDICPLAEAKLDKECHFKGCLENLKDNAHGEIYVRIEANQRSEVWQIKTHILMLKKLILYFICFYFDTKGILTHVS